MNLNIYSFLIGIVACPFLLLAIWAILWVAAKGWAFFKRFFFGLGIIQWPAMGLIVIGLYFLKWKQNAVLFRQVDGRFWMSPNVDGFKVKREK